MYDRAPPSRIQSVLGCKIRDMDCLLCVDGVPEAARRTRLKSAAPLIVFDKRCWHPEMRHCANATALAQEHLAKFGPADRDGMLQHRLEHRLQLSRRTGDDLEHLGGCRLLLQRLAQLACSRLHLIEQPHVLNGNYGMSGEIRDQLDLLVGERTNLLTIDGDDSN
jgi:hypothetical protein